MKIGVSTYCFLPHLKSGHMQIPDMLQWIKEQGGDHVEVVPAGFTLDLQSGLTDEFRRHAESAGLRITNYSVPGNFLAETPELYQESIRRMKEQVEIAARLGVKRMRHDVVDWGHKQPDIMQFEMDFPKLVEACREIADYASQYGITTSIENHGFYVTMSERVLRLIQTVDRSNFKMTLDIGNFLCVDENPLAAVKRCLPYASIVHVKDFYIRAASQYPGEGWLKTVAGNYIRGAIFGQGDLPVRDILAFLQESGYDGDLVLEFEGWEDCLLGTKKGMENISRIWDEAKSGIRN